MRRTIFIGDVHGCIDELEDLLRACALTDDDQVILVGDLMAKGPDSQAVVQLAREAGFGAVLGNHDDHVLQFEARPSGPDKRAEHAAIARSLGPEDFRWLKALPLWLELETGGRSVIAVHGGLVPGVPVEQQERKFLLNLRSIRRDGSPSRKVEAEPWASVWTGPAHVVFGHDAVRGLQQHPHATGLDTGCVYGHRLTALVWPERRLVSVPARRRYAALGEG